MTARSERQPLLARIETSRRLLATTVSASARCFPRASCVQARITPTDLTLADVAALINVILSFVLIAYVSVSARNPGISVAIRLISRQTGGLLQW